MNAAAAPRYTTTAITLHWLLGILIVGLFVVGLYMTSLPFSPQRLKLYNWHKWAGILVLTLSFVRLMWRLAHRPPVLPASIAMAMPLWQRWAHHGTHGVLYLLFFAVPLLGWAYSSAAGFPIVVFGLLPLPDFVPVDKPFSETLKLAHHYAAYMLAACVLLHVGAAFKHQFLDRDGLIGRMWPGRA